MKNTSYKVIFKFKNSSEYYRKDKKGWFKISTKGRKFRMSAEQVLNHILPAIAGVKPGITIKVKHSKR